MRVLLGLHERVARRPAAGDALGDAEGDELPDAVLDVEPHAAERLHQRFDVERFFGTCAQESQERGAQRRLHERLEARLDVRRLGSTPRNRQVLHVALPRLLSFAAAIACRAAVVSVWNCSMSRFISTASALAVPVTAYRARSAGTLDQHVREKQVAIDEHRRDVRDVHRVFAAAGQLRREVHDARRRHGDLRWKQQVATAEPAGAEDVIAGHLAALRPDECHGCQTDHRDDAERATPSDVISFGQPRALHRASRGIPALQASAASVRSLWNLTAVKAFGRSAELAAGHRCYASIPYAPPSARGRRATKPATICREKPSSTTGRAAAPTSGSSIDDGFQAFNAGRLSEACHIFTDKMLDPSQRHHDRADRRRRADARRPRRLRHRVDGPRAGRLHHQHGREPLSRPPLRAELHAAPRLAVPR